MGTWLGVQRKEEVSESMIITMSCSSKFGFGFNSMTRRLANAILSMHMMMSERVFSHRSPTGVLSKEGGGQLPVPGLTIAIIVA